MERKKSVMRKIIAFLIIAAGTAAGWAAFNALTAHGPDPGRIKAADTREAKRERTVDDTMNKDDKGWKKSLTAEQYKVLRQCGTERPFSGKYNDFWEEGTYYCAGCGTPLFASKAKYEHGTGWPSFFEPIEAGRLELREDRSFMMARTEVRCATCGGHLGHVFDDGPAPSRLHYCVNSAALDFQPAVREPDAAPAPRTDATELATFAAGCFWGVEHKLRGIPGVVDARVGYTGGTTSNPTYEEVCADRTGHAEAVEVRFDPSRVGYKQLLDAFFALHDPTQLNRQGPDVGTQYRSAIFTHGEEQRRLALEAVAALQASGRHKRPVVTQVVPAGPFTRAEEYHQRYHEKNGGSCLF
jgi:peptide methionine sulfoxide reductase msrA/msrB